MPQPPRTAQEIADYLLARNPQPPLMPTKVFDDALTDEIAATPGPATVKAGLYLLNDDLPQSHQLAQSVEGNPLGDYWHAIIHRREGDWNNARYWFGHVGPAPILVQVYGVDSDSPDSFVERCRTVGNGQDTELETFQKGEMAQLLAYAMNSATSS
jgi:hypothetical protein